MARPTQFLQLSDDDFSSLTKLLSGGASTARTQTRARILDLLHRRTHPDSIAELLRVGVATVYNVKRRYLEADLAAALSDKPRSGTPVQILGETRAQITALACSTAPAGRARWTLRLLADSAVELGYCEAVSYKTVGEILKKTNSARTNKNSGASEK